MERDDEEMAGGDMQDNQPLTSDTHTNAATVSPACMRIFDSGPKHWKALHNSVATSSLLYVKCSRCLAYGDMASDTVVLGDIAGYTAVPWTHAVT